jgi:uncharacterized Zn finger protein (UPF0148 family)
MIAEIGKTAIKRSADWLAKGGNMVSVVINCDGYYPTCGECGCELVETDVKCPKCDEEIDWNDKR